MLPYELEEFIEISVACRCGVGWTVQPMPRGGRLGELCHRGRGPLDDDVLYAYCAEFAMGLALVRARHLDSDVHQLALWDGQPPTAVAGTAADVARWRTAGDDTIVVAPGRWTPNQGRGCARAAVDRGSNASRARVVRAMLIGDISGFSKLIDEQLPSFARTVLGAFAAVLGRHDTDVEYRNTWGDALYVCRLRGAGGGPLRFGSARGDGGARSRGRSDSPAHLAFRLSGHIEPVFPIRDPVLDTDAFMGSHVSRTARIEPVTRRERCT